MSGVKSLSRDVDLDIAGLLGAVWKKKWWILAFALITAVTVFVVFSGVKKRYQSEMMILLEKPDTVFDDNQNAGYSPGGSIDENTIGNEIIRITSIDFIRNVIDELELTKKEEFSSNNSQGLISDLAGAFLGSTTSVKVSPQDRAVDKFRDRLSVYPAEKSRGMAVIFWSHDSALSQKIVQTMGDLYIKQATERRANLSQGDADLLKPQIEKLRLSVVEAEEKISEYKQSEELFEFNDRSSLSSQQLSETSSELSRIRANRSNAEATIATVKLAIETGAPLEAVPEIAQSPQVQKLVDRKQNVETQIAELSITLLPGHPRLKALRSQLPAINRLIAGTASQILKGLENRVTIAQKQEEVLKQDINRLKAETARAGDAQVELRALEIEAEQLRKELRTALERRAKAQGRQKRSGLLVNASVGSSASLPLKATYPKPGIYAATAGFAALILATMLFLTIELLSGRAFKPLAPLNAGHIPERIPPIAPIGAHMPGAQQDAVQAVAMQGAMQTPPMQGPMPQAMHDPALSAQMASQMAAQMGVQMPNQPPLQAQVNNNISGNAMAAPIGAAPNVTQNIANDVELFDLNFAISGVASLGRAGIAVVSPSGNGSHTAWSLARNLSTAGHSVAIVDFTGDNSTAREMIGPHNVPGLNDVLSGALPLERALFKDQASNVHVMTSHLAGAQHINAAGLKAIRDQLAAIYAFVVYDCGPVGIAGLGWIADSETVVLVPTTASELNQCRQMEQTLRAAGYSEAILVQAPVANVQGPVQNTYAA